jgi:hypothetical protein
MEATKDTLDNNPLVESSFSVDDASPEPVPNSGLLAWLQVAGSFCLYFSTWGKQIPPTSIREELTKNRVQA